MPLQQSLKSIRILYIEDDAITRSQLSQFLKTRCQTLYVAADGQEGLALYQQFRPDIVITDIEMPKINGLALAKKIRAISRSTQIIIITAYKKPQYLFEAVNLQLVQYLLKPISLQKINQVLDLTSQFIKGEVPEARLVLSEGMYYDSYTKELVGKNYIIALSKYERALLELLIKKYPAPVSYAAIDAHIYDYNGSKNAIKLLINALRNKTAKGAVLNVPGFGYKLSLMGDN